MSYMLNVKNNSFSRSTANEMKMGAYYTDVEHCLSLSDLFKWPEEDEVCVLEPSIGDGSAVIATTKPDINKVKIFGVELNDEVAKETKSSPFVEDVLSADFTNGVKIKNQFFTFCFGNPPYMDDEDQGDRKTRLERTFLEKVTGSYLKKGAVLVWVIPYKIFSDIGYLRYLMNHYEKVGVWKFRKEEYSKWHQVVYVGRKIDSTYKNAETVQAEAKLYANVEDIPELPMTFEGTDLYRSVEVMPSDSKDLNLFATAQFDAMEAYRLLTDSGIYLEDSNKLVSNMVTQKEYQATDLGKPPIPLKKDSMYLMATSGVGQGETGDVGEDFHLQRGVAEVVEDLVYQQDESDPDKEVVKVTTRTEVSMTLIETDGTITVLK